MPIDINPGSNPPADDKNAFVAWSGVYKTGIELIDGQHKQLVDLTNELYRACQTGNSALQNVFMEAMSRMVEYVKFHFSAEMEILERIKYPQAAEHKKQHNELIKKILEAAKEHTEGKKFVPNAFVRTLKDWIISHIAVHDKNYSLYITAQKNKGLLTDAQIIGA
jgi:hemerythrin